MDAFKTETLTTADNADIPPGYTVRVEYFSDNHSRALPWEEFDGHGIIRHAYSAWGRPDKKPGEKIIHSDRGDWWLYDVQASTEKARREKWGLAAEEVAKMAAKLGRAPTQGEITAAAVARDADYCAGWLDGRYSWVCISAYVLGREGEEVESDHLGGVEWDNHGGNEYAEECAGEVVANALHSAGLTLEQRRRAWLVALREARIRREWAARGVLTV